MRKPPSRGAAGGAILAALVQFVMLLRGDEGFSAALRVLTILVFAGLGVVMLRNVPGLGESDDVTTLDPKPDSARKN